MRGCLMVSINARFAGTCYVCGRDFAAGARIEWSREQGSRHSDCLPTPIEDDNVVLTLDELVEPGDVLRHDDGYVTVLGVNNTFYVSEEEAEDIGGEPGHWYVTVCRISTDAEAAPLRAEDARRARALAAYARLADLAADVRANGERPAGSNAPEGVRLFDSQTIYGGGDWWIVTPEHVWYVLNNGADGDDWRGNNVQTGGAGAIGWRVSRTPHVVGLLISALRDIKDDAAALATAEAISNLGKRKPAAATPVWTPPQMPEWADATQWDGLIAAQRARDAVWVLYDYDAGASLADGGREKYRAHSERAKAAYDAIIDALPPPALGRYEFIEGVYGGKERVPEVATDSRAALKVWLDRADAIARSSSPTMRQYESRITPDVTVTVHARVEYGKEVTLWSDGTRTFGVLRTTGDVPRPTKELMPIVYAALRAKDASALDLVQQLLAVDSVEREAVNEREVGGRASGAGYKVERVTGTRPDAEPTVVYLLTEFYWSMGEDGDYDDTLSLHMSADAAHERGERTLVEVSNV